MAASNYAQYAPDGTLQPSSRHLRLDPPGDGDSSPHHSRLDRLVVTLVGAGRGPLILCALAAAQRTKRSVVIYAIEKNPNAIVTLQSLHASLHWGEGVHVVEADMRTYRPVFYSDVILSELLGSFGDNELSPECLIGTEKYLIDGGVYLPRDCTSYLACCMSSRIWNNVKKGVCRHR